MASLVPSSLTTVPNEEVIKAIEKAGYTCSVATIIKETGLEADLVEEEMAKLLRLTNGFFEVSENGNRNDPGEVTYVAQVLDTTGVKYIYPSSLRAHIRTQLFAVRFREGLSTVGQHAFRVFRVSFGVILLLSILIIVVVAVVVLIAATQHGGGDNRRGLPIGDVLRPVYGRSYYRRNDLADLYWCWWWYYNNPFFHGYDYAAQQHWRQQQERRRLMAELDDEEYQVPQPPRRGFHHDDTDQEEDDDDGEAELEQLHPRGGAVPVREMGFLESVFSFLFGDGPPGPSVMEYWRMIARHIARQHGVVLPEELRPLLLDPGKEEATSERVMLPVLARFGGRPISGEAFSGVFLDFRRLRERRPAGDDNDNEDEDDSSTLPIPDCGYYKERLWVFSEAPEQQLFFAGGLGLVNLLGALWLQNQIGELSELFPMSARFFRLVAGLLLAYALLFFLIPLMRYALYLYLNQEIRERDTRRQECWEAYQKLVQMEGSIFERKRQVANNYREKVWQEGQAKS